MQFGSVCSGIEAASVAWAPLGWKAAWLAEIEPFPCAVLAHHYPSVPNLGDMTKIARAILTGEVPAPDVLCGGTPCQAFSVAGLRKSLDDARGNLSLVFCEIANAIDSVRVVRGQPPAIVFWENVPGVLSTKDNAFGCFLGGLAGEDGPLEPPGGKWANAGAVYGPKRAVAWRVLDAQYFGVAQRRRRVFVVASARKGFDPAQVLFEWGGVRRDSAPSREAGKVAPTTPSRSTAGGGLGTDFDCDGGTICVATGQAGAEIGADMAPTLNCNHEAPYVARTLRGEGFDASEDGTGRGTPLVPHVVGPLACNTDPNGHDAGNFACNQAVDAGHVLPVAFAENSRHELRLEGGDGQRTGALSTGGGKPGQGVPMIAFPANLSGTQCVSAADVAPSMGAANPTAVAHVSIMPTMTAGGPSDTSHNQVSGQMRDAYMVPTTAMQVRRLTPEECEALQGFPRSYTDIPWTEYQRIQRRAEKVGTSFEAELRKHGKVLRGPNVPGCPDGPRYKALGNSWAIPCVSWIGERIARQINSSTTSPHPAGFFKTTL